LYCQNPIKSSAIDKAAVVKPSARELSIGITKLSGFNPLLKVAIAIVKEITTIAKTAIMFVSIQTRVNLRNTLLN
jgi:hypothetical protein